NGNDVVVHSVITSPDWRDDETVDPRRTLLSELHPGTFAERVAVPARNPLPQPAGPSFDEAACPPTARGTPSPRRLPKAHLGPRATVLVQGAGGGVSTALVQLGSAAGVRVWVTSRSPAKRAHVLQLGADEAYEADARLPERVDAVMETVGAATWAHSIRSLQSGGPLPLPRP